MKNKLYAFLLFFSIGTFSNAQFSQQNNFSFVQGEKCLSGQKHQQLYQNDPVYRQTFDANQAKIRSVINSGVRSGGVYTIPVVVHVIHLGEAEGTGTNISDAQIQSAIDNMNDAYSNTGYNGLDIEVQFVLAARDENCNATDGIVRINGSGVTGGGDNYSTVGITENNETTIKALSKWSNISYYNIWIVSEIDDNGGGSGTQGYAYFAGAGSSVDGAVILYNAFGYDPSNSLGYNLKSYTNYNVTAIHEIGHALNLYHTFEGDDAGSTCPANGDCSTDGDLCCDTDPHRRDDGTNCDAPVGNTCHGVSNSEVFNNFMAYSEDHCQDRFTSDQKTRMRAALESTRTGLITSLGGTAPSETGPVAATCSPDYTTPNSFNMGVANLEFNTITIASGTSQYEGGRQDRTCLYKTTVDAGASYPITIDGGASNNQDVEVYIDFNNDGDFDDANENVFSGSNNISFSGTVNIPASPTLNTYLRMRIIVDWFANTISGPCYDPQYGEVEEYAVQITSVSTVPVANFSASSTSVCNGSTITFTDASTDATGWSWNFGTGASPATASGQGPHVVTYTGAGFSTVTLDVTGPGGSDNETKTNHITRVSTVVPSVVVSSNDADNTICSGTSVTFTATPTNGGSTPSYQWKLNGGNVGSNSSSYNNSSLANGDDVSCVMTSSATCPSPVTGTSNTITMTVNSSVTPSVSISASANPINSGDPVTFTATPTNGGSTPSYQWKLNGGNVGSNSTTYNSSSLSNGDQVSCVMTSNATCASPGSATSNTVTMTVNSSGTCSSDIPGPGGVGNQNTTEIWLDAELISGINNGDNLIYWYDRSGNNNTFSQSYANQRPLFKTNQVNGKPSIDFDGTNDYLTSGSISDLNTSNISWFLVASPDNAATGHLISTDYTSGAGSGSVSIWKTAMYSGTGTFISFVRNSSGGIAGLLNHGVSSGYHIVSNTWDGNTDIHNAYTDGSFVSSANGCTAIPSGHQRTRLGCVTRIYSQYFNGKISEAIVYSQTLNDAERIIVDNYLGAKYNLPLTSNDIYSFESTHGNDAAGIGMINGTSNSSARGDIVEMSNPSTLTNGDFLMFAHDGAATSSTNSGVPSAYGSTGSIMTRAWRVDKTNDVGTVTVSFYLDGIATGGSTDFELLRDSDGNFTNATRITSGYSYDSGCDVATWTGVSFSDGDYFTIGNPDGLALFIEPITELTVTDDEMENPSSENEVATLEIFNNETEKVEMKLFPNPTTGILNIENAIEGAEISLFNTLGQLLYTSSIATGRNQFDFSEFNAGIYLVHLKDSTGETIAISQLMITK